MLQCDNSHVVSRKKNKQDVIYKLVVAAMSILHHDGDMLDPIIIQYEMEPLARAFRKILNGGENKVENNARL